MHLLLSLSNQPADKSSPSDPCVIHSTHHSLSLIHQTQLACRVDRQLSLSLALSNIFVIFVPLSPFLLFCGCFVYLVIVTVDLHLVMKERGLIDGKKHMSALMLSHLPHSQSIVTLYKAKGPFQH